MFAWNLPRTTFVDLFKRVVMPYRFLSTFIILLLFLLYIYSPTIFLNENIYRIGRPGVDAQVRHELEAAVVQVEFLMNEGALITVTADDSLHLWNFRQKRADVVHSLKFQRER